MRDSSNDLRSKLLKRVRKAAVSKSVALQRAGNHCFVELRLGPCESPSNRTDVGRKQFEKNTKRAAHSPFHFGSLCRDLRMNPPRPRIHDRECKSIVKAEKGELVLVNPAGGRETSTGPNPVIMPSLFFAEHLRPIKVR